MTMERDPVDWPRLRREPTDADEHVRDLLPSYVNGTLEPVEFGRVSEHLGRCAGCRASLRSWEAIGAAARSAAPDSIAATDGVLRRVMAVLDASLPSAQVAKPPAGRQRAPVLPPLPPMDTPMDDDAEDGPAAPNSGGARPFESAPALAAWHQGSPGRRWSLLAEVSAAAIVLLIVILVLLVYR